MLQFVQSSSEWSHPFKLSNQNFVRVSYLPNRTTRPAYIIKLYVLILTISGELYQLLAEIPGVARDSR
jgi:hypothetical protein